MENNINTGNIMRDCITHALTEKNFTEAACVTPESMKRFISSNLIEEMADRIAESADVNGRYSSLKIAETAAEYVPQLRSAPPGGWPGYCFDYIRGELFPLLKPDAPPGDYRTGGMIFLQIMRGAYRCERRTAAFDPTRDMVMLERDEYADSHYAGEYDALMDTADKLYIYEFMRIGSDITPYDTLGHMGGVHYVAMYVARQLSASGVPIDLALISGAAAGHDIGKFGCRKNEEKRVPYLHYYYTDICYRRFGLYAFGHCAANHSTWDLELENLSVESLVLIYSDFRVKSVRDENGKEQVVFHSLADAFDIILGKLDNVDAKKEKRYRKVYAKLRDFEDYMHERGIETKLPEVPGSEPPVPVRAARERVLLEGADAVMQLKYSAIDHNVRLMSVMNVDSELADLIEAARSESHWKNVRTYLSIFDEYSTYMTERQKLMTIKLVYELLAHKDGDIRTHAAELIGTMIAGFNTKYLKELPEGMEMKPRTVDAVSLFAEYLEKIVHPERRFTEQHRRWMLYSLNAIVTTIINEEPDDRSGIIDILGSYYGAEDDSELTIVLLAMTDVIDPAICSETFISSVKAAIKRCSASDKKEVRLAALKAARRAEGMSDREYFDSMMDILVPPGERSNVSKMEGNLFLDDLKMGTHWLIKVMSIELMAYLSKGNFGAETIMHLGTHLANLLKISERVRVRKAAGDSLLGLVPYMTDTQRNELAVELYNGLETGDRQYTKYIPYYLGKISLSLEKAEFIEMIDTLEAEILKTSYKSASFMIDTIGVILEEYDDYMVRAGGDIKEHDELKVRLLYIMIKAYSHFDDEFSREAFVNIGRHVFASRIMTRHDKELCFTHSYKKILMLLDERSEDELGFYSNAAVLNHIYRYISSHEQSVGEFAFDIPERVCFYPGTFDPFSLGHKEVAMRIRDMGFDVYLALDEFSWSKHTQAKLLRRRIMTMSAAEEERIYSFPDDIPINIANKKDIRRLKEIFAGKQLYIAVGTDVMKNASAYMMPPSEDSVHSLNTIAFERESKVGSANSSKNYPVQGELVRLTIGKYFEDISSTRIRDNIDLNRDISGLIDRVAQDFIYANSMYLREPAYKHVIESRKIGIESFKPRGSESIWPIAASLSELGYDTSLVASYLSGNNVRTLYIRDTSEAMKVSAFAACHGVGTKNLLREFKDPKIASVIRAKAEGSIAAIGFLYAEEGRIAGVSQMILTELLTELIARDYGYAIYNPADKAGYDIRIAEALMRQGFEDISGGDAQYPIYAVSLKKPVIIFKDVETVVKAPFNKNEAVLTAIDEAHERLLNRLSGLYPGKLLLSFNTGEIQNKIIAKVAELNGTSADANTDRRGPYMAVPFGKALGDVVVPNTVTKMLVVEKYFNRTVKGFTVAEAKNSSPLDTQVKMIKSFDRPVILIDDLLHKGHRMNMLGPILKANDVDVKKVLVGVMTGDAMDRLAGSGFKTESAYFLPTLEVWLNEKDCYPFIGGDSIEAPGSGMKYRSGSSANLILPYIKPGFIAGGGEEAVYSYSLTCLENARHIMGVIEAEYQKIFERKLTLERIGEAITIPRIPEIDIGVSFDTNLEPTIFIDNDIERLTRLKWGM